MEVIYSIFVPLFDYDYSTSFSTVKPRVLISREQFVNIPGQGTVLSGTGDGSLSQNPEYSDNSIT